MVIIFWKSLVKDIGYTLTANKVTIIDSDANNMPGLVKIMHTSDGTKEVV